MSYQTNLNVQHELDAGLVLEVGYIDNESRHLTGPDFSLNQVPTELLRSGDTQSLRPFPQFSNVTWINPAIGTSSYHAVFLRAQKRFADSFSLLGHYTWSRFYDDVTAADEFGSTNGSYRMPTTERPTGHASGSDIPHHFVLTVLYEVPDFSDNPGRRRWVLGGWRLGVAADGACRVRPLR